MALALMAQSAPQTTPAPDAGSAKSCACCNHDNADGKMACCGKDSKCATKEGTCCQGKDGKTCSMTSKDSSGKATCCADGKCPMMSKKDGKSCCGGKMCGRPQSGM
jgi:hypothetical protein